MEVEPNEPDDDEEEDDEDEDDEEEKDDPTFDEIIASGHIRMKVRASSKYFQVGYRHRSSG